MVCLSGTSPVCLVHLVSPIQPNKPDRPNRPNEQDRLADSVSIPGGALSRVGRGSLPARTQLSGQGSILDRWD